MDNERTIEDYEVVNYVDDQLPRPRIYLLLFDEKNETKKLKRIQVDSVYIFPNLGLRPKNIIMTEEIYLTSPSSCCLPTGVVLFDDTMFTFTASWFRVEKSNDRDLESEIFNGMIDSKNTHSVYLFDTSKIICKDTITIHDPFDDDSDDDPNYNPGHDSDDDSDDDSDNCSNYDFSTIASNFLRQYANKIRRKMDVLDSELLMKKDEYERELDDMRNEHQSNIDSLNLEHSYELLSIENEHENEISELRAEHEKYVSEIKREHERELKILKKLLNFVINDECFM